MSFSSILHKKNEFSSGATKKNAQKKFEKKHKGPVWCFFGFWNKKVEVFFGVDGVFVILFVQKKGYKMKKS